MVGCSDNVSLKGKVIYSDDKSPVPIGTICFETDTFMARGDLKPDGTYTAGSLNKSDGLPRGTYRVYVADARKFLGSDGHGKFLFESLIDPKFASGTTSGITIELTGSKNNFVVEVDRYDPNKSKK